MALISIASIIPKSRQLLGRRGCGDPMRLVFTTDASSSGRRAVRFTLGELLLKKARIINGDKVEVLFDPNDKTGLIRRTDKASVAWSISVRGTNKKSADVRITWFPGMPSIAAAAQCESVTVGDEGILFAFPKATTFGLVCALSEHDVIRRRRGKVAA